MDTSDDPVFTTAGIAAILGVGSGMALSKMMAGGGSVKMPSMTAENKQTAPQAPETEDSRANKLKRRGASVLTKDWSINLGQPGLLGL